VLEKDNLNRAWKRVRANKGAPGMDQMTVGAYPAFARDHIGWIVEKLRAGTYRPAPVLRAWISKPDGRQRPLGDQWLRRLIRLCYWKDWRRPRKRRAMLMRLGIDRDRVKLASRSRKGYWRMSSNSIVQQALANQWLVDQGFVPLSALWCSYKYGDQAKPRPC